jgi:hypothetical protein
MDCKPARQQLYRSEKSLALWLHFAFCGKCRAEARALRLLEQALAAAPRPEPPAALLANLLAIAQKEPAPMSNRPVPAPWQGRNRLAFWLVWAIIAALLALSFAVAYVVTKPKPVSKPEAPPAPTVDVAPVPDKITSAYIKAPTNQIVYERWSTPSAYYERYTDYLGNLQSAFIWEPERNRWWCYERHSNTQYVTDLTPVMADAMDIFAKSLIIAQDLEMLKKWDCDDYSRATIEYNAPKPDWVDVLQAPPGTKTLTATAKITRRTFRGRKVKSLQAWVGNTLIVTNDVFDDGKDP